MVPKLTTKQKILKLLEARGDWVNIWDLVNRDTEFGFLPVSARTRIQELVQEGKVERRIGDKNNPLWPGKHSWYRYKKPVFIKRAIRDFEGNIEGYAQVGVENRKIAPKLDNREVLKPEARIQKII